MKKLIYGAVLTLLVAGIVHIAIILIVPYFAARDAWTTLSRDMRPWTFSTVATPGSTNSKLPQIDPMMGVAACLFDLSEAPLQVEASGALPFWSVAVFDRLGRNIYSFNDRTAIEGELYLLVVNAVQRARLLKTAPPEFDSALVVETESRQGFVLLRALQPDPSWRDRVATFLQQANCSKFELPADS